MVDNRPSALPWLENKRLEEEKIVAEEEKRRIDAGESTFGVPANKKPVVKEYRSGMFVHWVLLGSINELTHFDRLTVRIQGVLKTPRD